MGIYLDIPGQVYGDGSDGDLVISATATQSQIKATATGTSGTRSLSSTNASYAANQLIFIIQSQGTGAGNCELNKILSYSAGTITTARPLQNTYGAGAQCIVVPEYRSILFSGSYSLDAPAWDGSTGGWVVAAVSGKVSGSGGTPAFQASGKGYRGGNSCRGLGQLNNYGLQGEGTTGTGGQTCSNNNGGGGSSRERNTNEGANAGAGGGHGAVGGDGGRDGGSPNSACTAAGGGTLGSSDLTAGLFFGGAGGGGGCGDTAVSGSYGVGGNGAGGILIICREWDSVYANATGSDGVVGSGDQAGGGGGAGGTIYIKCQKATLGTNIITALGGAGGTGNANGGAGAVGRIRVEAGTIVSGSTNPTYTSQIGGVRGSAKVGTTN